MKNKAYYAATRYCWSLLFAVFGLLGTIAFFGFGWQGKWIVLFCFIVLCIWNIVESERLPPSK